MAVIQDLVLTFCPTMHSVQQKKLKLLMPVLINTPLGKSTQPIAK